MDLEDILSKYTEQMVNKKSSWIDKTITENVPMWKLRLLKKCNFPLLRIIIGVNIEIINEELIANFGIKTTIKLNGRVIGSFMYKDEYDFT